MYTVTGLLGKAFVWRQHKPIFVYIYCLQIYETLFDIVCCDLFDQRSKSSRGQPSDDRWSSTISVSFDAFVRCRQGDSASSIESPASLLQKPDELSEDDVVANSRSSDTRSSSGSMRRPPLGAISILFFLDTRLTRRSAREKPGALRMAFRFFWKFRYYECD